MDTATLQTSQKTQMSPSFARPRKNPWASDTVLMGLSVWWVYTTHPESKDPSREVAAVFDSLQSDLQ